MKTSEKIIAWIFVTGLLIVGGCLYFGQSLQKAGNFPGGILPTSLFTGSISQGVYPVGNLPLGAPNGFYLGGLTAANQVTAFYTATAAYPASVVTLGPITVGTSATSTQVAFTALGFAVGDSCNVSYNGATTTGAFGADGFVTAVNGNAVTSTATFWNGSTATTTLTVTSSATGVSSTLKLTCFHVGV